MTGYWSAPSEVAATAASGYTVKDTESLGEERVCKKQRELQAAVLSSQHTAGFETTTRDERFLDAIIVDTATDAAPPGAAASALSPL